METGTLGYRRLVQRGALKCAGGRIVTVPRVTQPRESFNTKCLVCLRQADLPLCSRALDASAFRGASVAVTTAGQNVVALRFVTHAATTPTPTLHTSSTLTPAIGFAFLLSKINGARSSIESNIVVRQRRDQADALCGVSTMSMFIPA